MRLPVKIDLAVASKNRAENGRFPGNSRLRHESGTAAFRRSIKRERSCEFHRCFFRLFGLAMPVFWILRLRLRLPA